MPMRLVARLRSTQASACSALSPLNQFNLVPVWIGDEGNHGGAAFDGASFARDVAASGLDLLAGGIRVRNAQRDMTIGVAVVIAFHAPVIGQFNFCLAWVAPLKSQKRQRILVFGVLRLAQQLHAQHLGVEVDRALKVANAQHGVKESHAFDCAGKSKTKQVVVACAYSVRPPNRAMWLHCSDVYRRVETDVRSVAAETPEENALGTGLSIAPGDACGRLNVQSGTNEVAILAPSQQSYITRYDVYYVK